MTEETNIANIESDEYNSEAPDRHVDEAKILESLCALESKIDLIIERASACPKIKPSSNI